MTVQLTRRRASVAIGMIILGLIGGLGGGWLATYTRAEEVTAERDEAVVAAEANCEQLEQLGWTCVKDPEDLRGEAGPQGPPPSDEQVRAALELYFEEHPVEPGASAEEMAPEIAAAVAAYLAEHPPEPGEPGPAPTGEQIAAALLSYLAENPPPPGPAGPAGPQGEAGADGQDGQAPTKEEIASAVADYVAEHPLPMCPEGASAEAHTVLTTGGTIEAIVCVTQEAEEN